MFKYIFATSVALVTGQVLQRDLSLRNLRDQCDWATIPDCAAGVRPTIADGCPDCVPAVVNTTCLTKTCTNIPECGDNQFPERNGCCPSCRPKLTCTKANAANCKETMAAADFPTCDNSTTYSNAFDRSTCCFKCKRSGAGIVNDMADPDRKRCTREQFKTCLASTPTCEPGQKPQFDGLCCLTCRRPAARQPLRRIAKCADIRQCADQEEPTRQQSTIGSFECPSCRRPKPVCDPGCSERQRCVRSRRTDGPKCVNKVVRRLRLRAKRQAAKSFLSGANTEQIKETFLELVARLCDNPDNAEKCQKHQQTLIDGLLVRIEEVQGRGGRTADVDQTDVVVDVPNAVAADPVRRRLLASEDTPAGLLDDAVANVGNEDADFSITASTDSSASGLSSSFAATAALIAALGAFL